jgi:hypothetical protein
MAVPKDVSWINSLYDALDACGAEGCSAADYLRRHRTRLGFRRMGRHVGAFWTPWNSIKLNLKHYTCAMPVTDPNLLTMVIHETRHLQQGLLNALSVYGELEAWQLQFREYHRLTGKPIPSAIAELLSLPLGWDRVVLMRARELMKAYAGRAYRADLLPLYPLYHELAYLLTRRPPNSA